MQTGSIQTRPVLVLVLEGIHALDFAGPVQAVAEARQFGAAYDLRFVGPRERVRAAQGFTLAALEPLPPLRGDEWILVPGTESTQLESLDVPTAWLVEAASSGARVTSVCSGAFALARAGLLEGRRCTTHWKVLERLRAWSPRAEVLDNRLFVRDENLVTSAGVASGIDMALALIEEDHGPRLTAQVAREMVVYLRRQGDASQSSIHFEHRDHLHPAVHRVQDWILAHPDQRVTLDDLARHAALSPRQLTRVFRQATGITVKTYQQKVRLEVARSLLRQSQATIDDVAARCGFDDARQLRRLWRRHFGTTLREGRPRRVRSPVHTLEEGP
jgi:transcriptional regulator GlxA family with amidase domain